MGWQKSFPSLGIPAFTLCPALLIFSMLPPQLPPQSYLESTISLKFPPTDRRGSPSSSVGGGTRRGTSCIQQGQTPLTALMPRNNVATTVVTNPTLFWYVPKTTAESGEFVLLDNEQEVYRRKFALTATPGIVNIRLPATTSLKVGKTYQWQFALICPTENSSDDQVVEFIEGQIERTELSADTKAKLAQAAPLEQARLYANDSIWQETLTIIARLRSSYPVEWQELLESVGLDKAIAQAPFVEHRPAAD